ncbi:MAG: UPF0280 family protein [Candidatus Hadarchaeota archaeon]
MYEKRWSFKETSLLIKCDEERAIDAAIDASLQARREVEGLIVTNPEFRWSLEPLELGRKYPRVIELMLKAAGLAEVGPFAAVAGAISQVAAEAALSVGAKNVIIENGGDIAIAGNQEFRVGIFAGGADGPGKIGFLVRPAELPIGICTSSGTVGHSMSFGEADAVTVVARDAALADAAATSIANAVKGSDLAESVGRGLERAKLIPEIKGCLVIREKYFGAFGKIPELFGPPSSSKIFSETFEQHKNYGA